MEWKSEYLKKVYRDVCARDGHEPEFLQAVEEVLASLEPVVAARPALEKAGIVERLVEPERVITFRVSWVDDSGKVQVNRGYRCSTTPPSGLIKGAFGSILRSTCPS